MQTKIAVVCVAMAGIVGMKAYNAANKSEADMLLAENVEALSWTEYDAMQSCILKSCTWHDPSNYCDYLCPNYGKVEKRRNSW